MSEMNVETTSPKTAGFFSRMVAFILDIFLLTVVELISGLVIFLILQFFRIGQILQFFETQFGIDNQAGQYLALISPALFLIALFYFVFLWAFQGHTPGKTLLGLRIVRRDGRRISVWRAFVRYVAYWVSAIPLFLGFIWILFDRRHEGWHDKIAGTNVIYIPQKRPAIKKRLF